MPSKSTSGSFLVKRDADTSNLGSIKDGTYATRDSYEFYYGRDKVNFYAKATIVTLRIATLQLSRYKDFSDPITIIDDAEFDEVIFGTGGEVFDVYASREGGRVGLVGYDANKQMIELRIWNTDLGINDMGVVVLYFD